MINVPRHSKGALDRAEISEPPAFERRKLYFDGGRVEIAAYLVHELDPEGRQLREAVHDLKNLLYAA